MDSDLNSKNCFPKMHCIISTFNTVLCSLIYIPYDESAFFVLLFRNANWLYSLYCTNLFTIHNIQIIPCPRNTLTLCSFIHTQISIHLEIFVQYSDKLVCIRLGLGDKFLIMVNYGTMHF